MESKNIKNLPTIHFTNETLKPHTSAWYTTCKKVQKAFEENGCFIAIHDQFSCNEISKSLRDLFNLPLETKMQNTSFDPFFGYIGPKPTMPLYESMAFIGSPNLVEIENFASKLWPSGNEKFCEILHFIAKKLAKLDQEVSRMILASYGLENHLDSYMESMTYSIRFNKYRIAKEKEINMGLTPHTDKNLMSILHENQVSGLQVRTKDGDWITVNFPPSSLFFIAGDLLKAWSNGKIHAAMHRVVMNGNKERYTLGQFSYPLAEKLIYAPQELIDNEHPRLYKPLDIDGYLNFYRSPQGRLSEDVLMAYCGV